MDSLEAKMEKSPQEAEEQIIMIDDGEYSSQYFNDGIRRVDYVLAYEESDDKKTRHKRAIFEQNLIQEGLQLELEDRNKSVDGKTFFVKIHAPWEVLGQMAEITNMKMPIRLDETESVESVKAESESWLSWLKSYCCPSLKNPFLLDMNVISKEPNYFTAVFKHDRADLFLIEDKKTFFSPSQRSQIVWEILTRTQYDDKRKSKIGIEQLINSDTYLAAYPLHSGPHDKDTLEEEISDPLYCNSRLLLYNYWAKLSCWYSYQPLFEIRQYFGEKIGLYFAWLGFYTSMLIPAAIVGLFTFFYGCFTVATDVPSDEVCSDKFSGNLTMCPLCTIHCPYWRLHNACYFTKVNYLFDNAGTVFFSLFMALWATLFQEFWKRKQAELAWSWDLSGYEEENEGVRPEFEASVETTRISPVTLMPEPYLPLWKRSMRLIGAVSVVIFMLCTVVAALFGVIVYRMVVTALMSGSDSKWVRDYSSMTTSATAAFMNLLVIVVLDVVYRKLAVFLTDIENPRTHTEYEDSFTVKVFCFQFINFYSSLIYIAFFKGRFFGHPGNRTRLFKQDLERCQMGGCLFELCIQLAIIMIGKQVGNNFMEIGLPKLLNWWNSRSLQQGDNKSDTDRTCRQWEKDYALQPSDKLMLFDEYLEMVIQYGFITLFVAAFPLAPLFALLNNVVEIRLDAYKYVTQLRRPTASKAEDIGAWQSIIRGISVLAVISNGFVISYTSDFIPRMVYKYVYSPTWTLHGYVNHSLSKFDVYDLDRDIRPEDPLLDSKPVDYCRYPDYRNTPQNDEPYSRTMVYWHVFAARLAFVVIFEHIIFFITWVISYIIPDVPTEVKEQMSREKLMAKEALYAAQMQQIKSDNKSDASNWRRSSFSSRSDSTC
ncbi:Anoctamin-4 [Nymphon striatum]|nr:Anoctamin-4 [Nymphon striatum]